MERVRGIHAHSRFKLGKGEARADDRNLKFAALRTRKRIRLPRSYDFDSSHSGIPIPMFLNDLFGDCVIAGRAHQTLRFERIEQGSTFMIKDSDVLRQYLSEAGNEDRGLVVLDSLKLWRKAGWKVGRRKYRIRAFSELNRFDQEEILMAIYSDVGIGVGLRLPLSAQGQMESGLPWGIEGGAGSKAGSWGGHYVYVSGYTAEGPVCISWGRKQRMTWEWFEKYSDEAYAVFDERNDFMKSLISSNRIEEYISGLGSKPA